MHRRVVDTKELRSADQPLRGCDNARLQRKAQARPGCGNRKLGCKAAAKQLDSGRRGGSSCSEKETHAARARCAAAAKRRSKAILSCRDTGAGTCRRAAYPPCRAYRRCPNRPPRPSSPSLLLLLLTIVTITMLQPPPTCASRTPLGGGWGTGGIERHRGTGHGPVTGCLSLLRRRLSPTPLRVVPFTQLPVLSFAATAQPRMQASCQSLCTERRLDLHISRLYRPVQLLSPLRGAFPCQRSPIAPSRPPALLFAAPQKETRARVASLVPTRLLEPCLRRRVAMQNEHWYRGISLWYNEDRSEGKSAPRQQEPSYVDHPL